LLALIAIAVAIAAPGVFGKASSVMG
jgi:hypothetical protein